LEVKSKKEIEDLISKMVDCDCKVGLVSGGLGWRKGAIGRLGGLGIFLCTKNTCLLNFHVNQLFISFKQRLNNVDFFSKSMHQLFNQSLGLLPPF